MCVIMSSSMAYRALLNDDFWIVTCSQLVFIIPSADEELVWYDHLYHRLQQGIHPFNV